MVAAHMYAQYPWIAAAYENTDITGRGYPQTDDAETFYPNNVFERRAVQGGELPLWFPYSFSGLPLTELGLSGFLYPVRLLAAIKMKPIRIHDFLIFTHSLLAGLAMYALLRIWGASAFGGVFGAIVWELNGHNAFWLTLEHVSIAAAWLPVMFLCATLALRKQSLGWAMACGIATGIALTSGSINYVYMGAVALAAWYGTQTVLSARRLLKERKRRSALVCLLAPLVSALAAAAVGSVEWLPMMDWLSRVHRTPMPLFAQQVQGVMTARFLGGLVWPLDTSTLPLQGPDPGALAFAGVIAIVLALAALLRRPSAVYLGLTICVIASAFVTGFAPMLVLLRIFPYFGTFHPHTGFFLLHFGIGILSAFGLTEVERRLAGTRLSRHWIVAGACVLVIAQSWQLISFARAINPVQPEKPEWLFPETSLITTLRERQGAYHILPVRFRNPSGQWEPPVLAGKVAANFGLRSGSGYESLLPTYVAQLWRTIEGDDSESFNVTGSYRPSFYYDRLPFDMLEKVSVGVLVTPPGVTPMDRNRTNAADSLELVYQGQDGWVYRLTHALPRAFLVFNTLSVPDEESSLKTLSDANFDARQAAILIGSGPGSTQQSPASVGSRTSEASAKIIDDGLNQVTIESTATQAGILVLNDSWAPGWEAYVDGKDEPVLRVNYAFRGVAVPAGTHRVTFLYRPPLTIAAISISACSLTLAAIYYAVVGVILLVRERKRAQQQT